MFDTVDSLIGKFTTLVDKLYKVADKHTDAALTHRMVAAKAKSDAEYSDAEATRARKIAEKINNLINA